MIVNYPMTMNKKTIVIAVIAIEILVSNGLFVSLATAQEDEDILPVLLVHGYYEDASIWETWEEFLEADDIPFYTITFQQSDDKCGSAIEHARELNNIIQEILDSTDYEQVNIVGHSKGGLDARVYLASGTVDVANLIMIGTPNDGSPLAELSDICGPAVYDLRRGASATQAEQNPNTNYYTISGNWLSNVGGNWYIPGPDDGWVAVASVESEEYSQSLGQTSHYHNDLLEEEEYSLALDILDGQT
jgi:triacylglycerol esterase/lipase EstA (alpha/beta hydrolase family)